MSLGTTFNDAPAFYQACFEAFADQPYQVLLSTGGRAMTLPEPPANVRVMPFVPQMEVLSRASVFVTHGGMNSANEGLWRGVPMVVVPQRGDQFLVARRMAELGAGVAITPAEVTSERLRDAVGRLIAESSFRDRARALGASLVAAGGPVRAADEIHGGGKPSNPAGRLRVRRLWNLTRRHRLSVQDLTLLAAFMLVLGFVAFEVDIYIHEGEVTLQEETIELNEALSLGAVLAIGLLDFRDAPLSRAEARDAAPHRRRGACARAGVSGRAHRPSQSAAVRRCVEGGDCVAAASRGVACVVAARSQRVQAGQRRSRSPHRRRAA